MSTRFKQLRETERRCQAQILKMQIEKELTCYLEREELELELLRLRLRLRDELGLLGIRTTLPRRYHY
jgi:hypothetical protein